LILVTGNVAEFARCDAACSSPSTFRPQQMIHV
jgi:hypothetical protein